MAELSAAKDELAETRQEHERKCAEFKLKVNEMAAAMETAAQNAATSDEVESLKRINAETLESLDGERSKTQGLLERLGEVNDQLESERSEKEDFRQEVLGLRSRLENTSGLSSDEVNGLSLGRRRPRTAPTSWPPACPPSKTSQRIARGSSRRLGRAAGSSRPPPTSR